MVDYLARIMRRSVRVGECLEWRGLTMGRGYGVLRVRGRKTVVSRAMWELHHGPIPEGMLVCHKCDNPPCVEISHLFLGTHADNAEDMKRKGRSPRQTGEKHWKARSTEAQILEIRARVARGETHRVIAADFGYHPESISSIASGRTWRHVK